MLTANSNFGRRSARASTPTTSISFCNPSVYLYRSRLPLKNCAKQKTPGVSPIYADPASFTRMKRLKTKKINGVQKMDLTKKKSIEYTEMAYREAVSKLKYLLAESYVPRTTTGKSSRNVCRISNPTVNESGDETDDHSIISDNSRVKSSARNTHPFSSSYLPSSKNIHPSKAYSSLAFSTVDLQSVPPELTSFIERQEEYIEQLEKESQYCREELTNLLRKVREVVAENEALQNKNKTGFLKSSLEQYSTLNDDNYQCDEQDTLKSESLEPKKHRVLEGPIIVFESRISELEAQLTQAKLELRKAQEQNELNAKRLFENSSTTGPEANVHLEQSVRAKYESELKLEELQKALSGAREREGDALQKAKRAMDAAQQVEFEKTQCEAEIKRLKEELDRQHERLREATQEANRRIAEERQQAERRYSQQVEQLSADVASHWDAASKSQLESEKQRRELTELRRELSQKQTFIDNLKKELQNKISNLQSELNQAVSEKDAAEQEVLATKLATERSERQARQEQSRLQAEINSYKQRLERADADLVHCRRENLRLSEQIASLEKEINMTRAIHSDESRASAPLKADSEKGLSSMIMDIETKHAATVAGLEDALNNQATLVSQLTAECQSLTQRLDANNRKYKDEIASLHSNIEHLTNKIESSFKSHEGNTLMKKKSDFASEEGSAEGICKQDYIVPRDVPKNDDAGEPSNIMQDTALPTRLEGTANQRSLEPAYQYPEQSIVEGGESGNSASVRQIENAYIPQEGYDQFEQQNPLEYENVEEVSYNANDSQITDSQYPEMIAEQTNVDSTNTIMN